LLWGRGLSIARLARSWLYDWQVLGSIARIDPGCLTSGFYSPFSFTAILSRGATMGLRCAYRLQSPVGPGDLKKASVFQLM
jgi:hypothetical protein